uniref:Peroxisomal membrane protein PEX14 n=2 Tax=Ixodes ricinus TaxID=34613 RepID=V5HBY8_IXORI
MRHVSSSVVLIGVACYGAYYLYKRFLEPYLRGEELSKEQNRLVQVQEQLDALTSAIGQLREAITSLESSVGKDRRDRGRTETLDASKQDSTLSDLKSEVLSVKALLLSRNQFPSTPKVTPLAVTIPAWQLSAGGDSKKENGTASGDSEEEHETNEQKDDKVTSNGQVASNVAAALV